MQKLNFRSWKRMMKEINKNKTKYIKNKNLRKIKILRRKVKEDGVYCFRT